MRFDPRPRLRRWYAAAKGRRVYLVALVLALPDILDGLVGFDWSPLLPEGWGAKVGLVLMLVRIFAGAYLRRLPPPTEEPR
ncbi:hypothetical protein [uncultured Methylobacterium sp.]|jgi:hypothetical protein|uniref:hypothetical protein n=1 Tax=uncultured Methylobacterium sp. TaxID=157278 RepID=UPI0026201251|nr:hypothetical protein [uncultured Methylobacterium sp.]